MAGRGARLCIIPLLKVSDCTEIIIHEIDSGISLKDLCMSGGFVQRNGFFEEKGDGKDKWILKKTSKSVGGGESFLPFYHSFSFFLNRAFL